MNRRFGESRLPGGRMGAFESEFTGFARRRRRVGFSRSFSLRAPFHYGTRRDTSRRFSQARR